MGQNWEINDSVSKFAGALQARRDLALSSVQLLLDSLRINDTSGIDIALRSLGVESQNQMVAKMGDLMSSLHAIIEDFQRSIIESQDEGLPAAVARLEQVIQTCFEAADVTLEKCEKQGYLYRDQRANINKLEKTLFDEDKLSDEIKAQMNSMRNEIDNMQIQNHEVIMAQSFQDISGQALKKVIHLMREIEQQILALTVACTEDRSILVAAKKSAHLKKNISQIAVDNLVDRNKSKN